ncbi:MAG: cob(I)yrinic acid a,c-diamide adenosyltransferase [Ignavibacteriales bacterium]|nr:cob(I)yrinic acid a,c-diamide adenosyltransferase [Ignavibacteriales bacterium]
MKIYTKTGDDGNTSLFGGERVKKNNLRIEAYGSIDELNASLGLVIANKASKETSEILEFLQNTLFRIGAELATPENVKSNAIIEISSEEIEKLEKLIDKFDSNLPELKHFILPGGSISSSFLHFSRTICRRAERKIVELIEIEKINNNILIFINRLSDLLFILARYENFVSSTPEKEWKSRG